MTFIGDSKYIGDGGSTLQRFYELWNWSEIPNCPGRYVTKKNREAEETSPSEVLLRIECGNELYESWPVHCKDTVVYVHFSDGGGLITYVKADGRFVHTLNTETGFIRKTNALGIGTFNVSD